MIVYNKLIQRLKDAKITSYVIRQNNIIGQATYRKIMHGGDIDTRTISKLCQILNCQPGDILEYIPDESQQKE